MGGWVYAGWDALSVKDDCKSGSNVCLVLDAMEDIAN
ncbi:hypothetical protein SAMN06265222_101823 [Neorhodopirellula lusitana]|uniref:Uncharacterized protein n=1 Tax=Neorhodopirellula lusitana TaxID=445327 RepID=A0ABY1PU05_9BACT|nr:hypothetical protein SAMN06265222_101823 [Neorhodopirellula lusitana]